MSDQLPVVADEEYEAIATSEDGPAPSWLPEAVGQNGWTLERIDRSVLTVSFADGNATDLKMPRVGGLDAARDLPSIATADIPIERLSFSREELRMEVEVADVAEQWAREWADLNMETGSPEQVPLGQGFASPTAALIDTGQLLMRGSWWSETKTVPAALVSGTPSPVRELLTLSPAG